MTSIKDVPADKLVTGLKEELKSITEMTPPEWVKFVKSGAHKQRPPEQGDFWYIRTASVLRRIYLDNSVGVQRLRTYFGGRKRYGHAPAHFKKSSGSVIRKILIQLEKAGLVEKSKNKGRLLTSKGRQFLNNVAYKVGKV